MIENLLSLRCSTRHFNLLGPTERVRCVPDVDGVFESSLSALSEDADCYPKSHTVAKLAATNKYDTETLLCRPPGGSHSFSRRTCVADETIVPGDVDGFDIFRCIEGGKEGFRHCLTELEEQPQIDRFQLTQRLPSTSSYVCFTDSDGDSSRSRTCFDDLATEADAVSAPTERLTCLRQDASDVLSTDRRLCYADAHRALQNVKLNIKPFPGQPSFEIGDKLVLKDFVSPLDTEPAKCLVMVKHEGFSMPAMKARECVASFAQLESRLAAGAVRETDLEILTCQTAGGVTRTRLLQRMCLTRRFQLEAENEERNALRTLDGPLLDLLKLAVKEALRDPRDVDFTRKLGDRIKKVLLGLDPDTLGLVGSMKGRDFRRLLQTAVGEFGLSLNEGVADEIAGQLDSSVERVDLVKTALSMLDGIEVRRRGRGLEDAVERVLRKAIESGETSNLSAILEKELLALDPGNLRRLIGLSRDQLNNLFTSALAEIESGEGPLPGARLGVLSETLAAVGRSRDRLELEDKIATEVSRQLGAMRPQEMESLLKSPKSVPDDLNPLVLAALSSFTEYKDTKSMDSKALKHTLLTKLGSQLEESDVKVMNKASQMGANELESLLKQILEPPNKASSARNPRVKESSDEKAILDRVTRQFARRRAEQRLSQILLEVFATMDDVNGDRDVGSLLRTLSRSLTDRLAELSDRELALIAELNAETFRATLDQVLSSLSSKGRSPRLLPLNVDDIFEESKAEMMIRRALERLVDSGALGATDDPVDVKHLHEMVLAELSKELLKVDTFILSEVCL